MRDKTALGKRLMDHRHLDTPGFTLAAIDDIIGRGSLRDWVELDVAASSDAGIMEKVRTVVTARSGDESSINHDFWRTRVRKERNGIVDR